MARGDGIYPRGTKLWMVLHVGPNKWKLQSTPFRIGEEDQAKRLKKKTQEQIDAGLELGAAPGAPLTVQSFGKKFLDARNTRTVSDDESRLRTWVYPAIGSMPIADVRARHLKEMIDKARAKNLAPRSVINIYSVCRSLFREAQIAGLIDASPCVLTHQHIGKKRDKVMGWREGAVYSGSELAALIWDDRVPQDRRVLYAIAGLAGLRHGEIAGLRWGQIKTGLEPLNRIVVLTSYDTGETKTGVERWVPVHPALAAILAEWKLSGWAREFGRAPTAEDIVVPHTQPTNAGPRVEKGGMRSPNTSLKRLMIDLGQLGFRRRRFHDLRRTMVTLAREGGADREILRLVTHGASGDVIEMYTSMGWGKLCQQVLAIRIERVLAKEA